MKRHRIVVHGGHSRLRIGLWVGAGLLLVAGIALGLMYLRDPHAGWLADPDSEIVQLREERKRLIRDLRLARDELDDLRLLQDLLRARLPLSVEGIPIELDEMPDVELILRDLDAAELASSPDQSEVVGVSPPDPEA